MRPSLTNLVVGFLLGTLTVMVVGVSPTRAAVQCDPNGSGIGSQLYPANNHFGEHAQVMTVNPVTSCVIVRSMYVWKNGDNFVEIGWYKDGTDQSATKCDDVTTPHVLVYAIVAGHIKCKPSSPAIAAGSWYSYKVENPNHANAFDYYWEGWWQGYYTTSFSQGTVDSFSEHHLSGESLTADFNKEKYMGSAGNYSAWEASLEEDTPPYAGYIYCPTGTDAFHVRTLSVGC